MQDITTLQNAYKHLETSLRNIVDKGKSWEGNFTIDLSSGKAIQSADAQVLEKEAKSYKNIAKEWKTKYNEYVALFLKLEADYKNKS